MALCLLIADRVYYANKLIRLNKHHSKMLNLLQFENFSS